MENWSNKNVATKLHWQDKSQWMKLIKLYLAIIGLQENWAQHDTHKSGKRLIQFLILSYGMEWLGILYGER